MFFVFFGLSVCTDRFRSAVACDDYKFMYGVLYSS
jgi:hypothetical protein